MSDNERLTDTERAFIDLADEGMSTEAIYYTGDFFASMQNMLNLTEPVHIDGKHTDPGK